jgi:hypothetical protein
MEEKIDEMQVASPQWSPRHPAVKRMEREDNVQTRQGVRPTCY